MNKVELIFKAILVPLDFVMLVLAGLAAYSIRFQTFVTEIRPVVYEMPFKGYLNIVLIMATLWVVIFALEGLYTIKGPRKIIHELMKVFFACSTGLIIIIILIFLERELFSSRFIILAAWGLSVVLVSLGRILIRITRLILLKYGIGARKIILVGKNKSTKAITESIKHSQRLGYKIVEHFDLVNAETLEKMKKLIADGRVEEILQSDPDMNKENVLDLIDLANEYQISFKYAADLFETKATNIEVTTIAGIPIIELKKTPLEGWGRIVKRLFDIICSLIFIILTSPILAIVAIAIKADSRGPIFYLNERVTKGGKTFEVFKFRTMKAEYSTGPRYDKTGEAAKLEKKLIEEKSQRVGPVYKVLKDPRRTSLGRLLEK
ncbi:MAG TPA: sugar transferase, partial [Patescibacteria group bacterium]